MAKQWFQEQVFKAREDAIVMAVNRLLADKGFDLMTLDEVASEVGIAKASLYKHFSSKEALAAAAMIRVLDDALVRVAALRADAALSDLERLRSLARWTIERQIAGQMPSLPAQNSSLRAALVANRPYLDRLMSLSDQVGGWIEAARRKGWLRSDVPSELPLYILFAKGCDPIVGVLKAAGRYSDAEITQWMVDLCFEGLVGTPPRQTPKRGR